MKKVCIFTVSDAGLTSLFAGLFLFIAIQHIPLAILSG